MSIAQFLRILIARWMLILGIMLACTGVATAVVLMLPKRYPASARVMLDLVKPDPVTGESTTGRDVRGYVRTQVELIKDMRVAGSVVDRLGLANNPQMVADYQKSGRSESDGGIRAWLAQQIIDNTDAGLVEGSNILEIKYQASNPDYAKQVVGQLRDAFINSSLRFRTDNASRNSVWFNEQAEKARTDLQSAEGRLAEFMEANHVVLVGGVDGDSAKLQQLQAALQTARGQQSSTDTAVAARAGTDPVVDQLRMQLAQIEDELAMAASKLGTEHPAYKALLLRRNTMQKQMQLAQSSSTATVSAMATAARSSVSELERAVTAQQQVVLDRKPVLDELIRLNREVELKRTQYERATSRTADLKLEAAASETGLVVLGDPTVERTPSYPKVGLTILLSAVFGLALGLLSAIIAEFIARRVRGPEDLAYATGVPVLVSVGSNTQLPLRQRLQKLLGRRGPEDDTGKLQAI